MRFKTRNCRTEKLVEKVLGVNNHRNGVSGAPFATVLFECDGRRMLGTLFESRYACGVVCLDDEVVGETCWRGDEFEPELRKIVEEWNRR